MANKFAPDGFSIVPQGANLIDLDDSGTVITFNVGHYDGPTIDAKFQAMQALGFNAVRLFAWMPSAGGSGANTLSHPYLDNLADAINRAYLHGLYTILSCGGLPSTYIPAVETGYDNTPSDPFYYIKTQNFEFFSTNYVTQRNLVMSDFLNYITSKGVTPNKVLALELTGEVGLELTAYPLNQWPGVGTVTTRTGTYNRAVPADQTALINAGMTDWILQQTNMCHFVNPAWKTMVQINPETTTQNTSLTIPYQTIFNSAADSIGFSLYPRFTHTLPNYIAIMGGGFPLLTKTCMTIETGWFVSDPGSQLTLIQKSIDWQAASCSYNIFGSLWFTWDTNHTPMPTLYGGTYINSTDNSSLFADMINPIQIGDGCGSNSPALAPIVATNRLHCKFYAPGKYPEHLDAPIVVIDNPLSAEIVIEQTNRFDSHTVEFPETTRDIINALPPFTTVDFEQQGIGVIARGLITKPNQQVDINHVGKITMEVPNITDQGLEISTGVGYLDADSISNVVRKLGSLPTKEVSLLDYTNIASYQGTGFTQSGFAIPKRQAGRSTDWSALYVNDGSYINASQPVSWAGLFNATNLGNSVIRNPGGSVSYTTGPAGNGNSGGAGLPAHLDPTRPFTFQCQIVIPCIAQAGVRPDQVIATPLYGFDFSAPVPGPNSTLQGTYTVLYNGSGSGQHVGTYTGNTTFSVALLVISGSPFIAYYVGTAAGSTMIGTPQPLAAGVTSFYPMAWIATPGGEVDNLIMTRQVQASEAWFQVQYDKLPQTGAFLQLAKDTGMFVRQARDASTFAPRRAFELGPMNKAAAVTLTDPGQGTMSKMRANQYIRVIKEVTGYESDCSGVYTVCTPLGSGSGDARIGIELLWRILNDPTYEDFQNNFAGGYVSVFPEYDPNFTIWRDGTKGKFEYYIVYEPAFGGVGYFGWLQTGILPAGSFGYKEGGPIALSQFVYPDQATVPQQEATQRGIYKAYVELMKRAVVPHVTVTLTTVGDWFPPRAGDKVHIDYRQPITDKLGGYSPLTIFTGGVPGFPNTSDPANPDPRVMKVTRKFSGDKDPEDDWIISNLGRYEDTVDSQSATQGQQIAAIQISNQNKTNVTHLSPAFSEIDSANPVTLPFYFINTTYKVDAFYLYLTYEPFRQPVADATIDNAAYFNQTGTQIFVTVGGIDIQLPLTSDLNAQPANIGGVPKHVHRSIVVKDNAPIIIPSVPFSEVAQGYLHVKLGDSTIYANTYGTEIFTSGADADIIDIVLDPTIHPHTVATAKTTIVNIPKTTALAELPQHFHPIPPGIKLLETPTGLTVWVDSGNGVLVDRTAFLVDTLTGQGPGASGFGSGVLLEMARFVNSPNRVCRIQIQSTNNASKGRGRIGYGGTLVEEIGGLGSVVIATQ